MSNSKLKKELKLPLRNFDDPLSAYVIYLKFSCLVHLTWRNLTFTHKLKISALIHYKFSIPVGYWIFAIFFQASQFYGIWKLDDMDGNCHLLFQIPFEFIGKLEIGAKVSPERKKKAKKVS